MAKKQEVVEVLLKLSDGNTIQVMGQKAKKATKEMDNLGKASQATDRRIKGVTQQSSNSTKNFSKQAQTMQGGIVAAYATIAAQVFALSAAFQFLKNAVNMSNLIAGQENFAAITGTAYKTLTKDIQAATAGQIQFAEAAQAAAIGTAAGLSPTQLKELGTAAKNTSLALGRDLTDSFQRLVRGTTKAEPELLDELGIILRLEPALKAYAVANKKTVAQLTQFEKSQAIANEVLGQAESKFGQITDGIDDGAFALQQFVVAFDELMIELQKGLGWFAKGVLPFFTDNVLALVGALGIILAPVLNSIFGDGMRNWAKNTQATARAASQASRRATDDAMYARQKFRESIGKGGPDLTRGKADLDAYGIKGAAQEGQMSARQIAAYKRSAAKKIGITKDMNRRQLADFKQMLKRQEIALKASTGRMQGMWTVMGTGFKSVTTSIAATWQSAMTRMAAATAWFAKKVNQAMRLMGWLGIALMIFEGLKALYEWIVGVDEAAKKEQEWLDNMTEKYKTLNTELENMNRKMKDLNHTQTLVQTGNKLQSIDIKQFINDYNEAAGKVGDMDENLKKQFKTTAAEVDKATGGRAKALRQAVSSGNKIKTEEIKVNGVLQIQYADNIQAILDLADVYIKGSQAQQKFAQTSRSLSSALQQEIKGTKQLGFANIRSIYQGYLNEATAIKAGSDETLKTQFQNVIFSPDGSVNAGNRTATQGQRQVASALNTRDMNKQAIYDIMQTDLPAAHAMTDEEAMQKHGMSKKDWIASLNFELDLYKTQLKDAQNILEHSNDPLAEALRTNASMGKVVGDTTTKQKELNQYVKDELAQIQAKEEIQRELVHSSFGSDAQMKNKQADAKQSLVALGIEDRRLAVEAAKFALYVAQNEGKVEDIENASEALRQANELYDLEYAIVDVKARQTEHQKHINEFKDKDLENTKKMKNLEQKIKVLQNDQTARIESATSADEERYEKLRKHLLDTTKLYIAEEKKKQLEAKKTKYIEMFGDPGDSKSWGNETVAITNAQGEVTGSKEQARTSYGGDMGYWNSLNRSISESAYNVAQIRSDLALSGRSSIMAQVDKMTRGASDSATTYAARFGQGITLNPGEDAYRKQLAKMGFRDDEHLKSGFEKEAKFSALKESGGMDTLNKQLETNQITIEEFNESLDSLIEKQGLSEAQVTAYEDKWKDAKEAIAAAAVETESLAIDTELMTGIQNTLSEGFTSMFQAMIDGSKSFEDSMKDLAKSVLADLAAMYLKAAALKMMMAWMPGGNSVVNFLQGKRYGGETTYGAKGYAYGGVASGPNSGYLAKLHGREAVVPLGNDRSIPVEMRGGGGGGNTVNVSISMNGQGQGSSQVTGDGMQGLGRSIGGLVQQHLQQEMRPGGLLNPQGQRGKS